MQLDIDRLIPDLEICINHEDCEECPILRFCSNCEYITGVAYDYVVFVLKARGVLYESD